MLNEKLKNKHIILASGSPRRHECLKNLGLDFEIRLKDIKEDYPLSLKHSEISDYLAQLKSLPYINELKDNDILITSDTIVWHNNTALGKPKDTKEAFTMLKALSNNTHDVITSICISTKTLKKTVNATTKVTFKTLTDKEIWHYINTYSPLDKAGAYGIQEWIGQIGVIAIEGSYYNVMGLPTHLLYNTLNTVANEF